MPNLVVPKYKVSGLEKLGGSAQSFFGFGNTWYLNTKFLDFEELGAKLDDS